MLLALHQVGFFTVEVMEYRLHAAGSRAIRDAVWTRITRLPLLLRISSVRLPDGTGMFHPTRIDLEGRGFIPAENNASGAFSLARLTSASLRHVQAQSLRAFA